MLSSALFAMLAAALVETGGPRSFVPGSEVRASGQAVVRLLSAKTIPMSADSVLDAPQRRTTIRLADGDHDAYIVEFE